MAGIKGLEIRKKNLPCFEDLHQSVINRNPTDVFHRHKYTSAYLCYWSHLMQRVSTVVQTVPVQSNTVDRILVQCILHSQT